MSNKGFEFSYGEQIKFRYNDKDREGVIDEVTVNKAGLVQKIRLYSKSEGFKSFFVSKIQNLQKLQGV